MANSNFENIIKSYLDKRAQNDSLFAQAYQKAGKSIKRQDAMLWEGQNCELING